MVRDGLIREGSFWGTINCDGIGPNGDICGVTTTSGLAWKIPGPHRRFADSRRRALRRQRGRRRGFDRPRRSQSLQPVVVPDRRVDAARACRRRMPAWRRSSASRRTRSRNGCSTPGAIRISTSASSCSTSAAIRRRRDVSRRRDEVRRVHRERRPHAGARAAVAGLAGRRRVAIPD